MRDDVQAEVRQDRKQQVWLLIQDLRFDLRLDQCSLPSGKQNTMRQMQAPSP